MFGKWKEWARALKRETFVLYSACRDRRVSIWLRLFMLGVAAYAFSPVDLIPDFVPVLGYVDDLLLVPLGIYLALKWLPKDIAAEHRAKAEELARRGKPTNWVAGALIILLYVWLGVWLLRWLISRAF
ncbi:YkvA family protein [Geobacillus subterraneus]|uniref:YkvA family protein n=1 Tax=Geobacillus subterraneus TaxID=129338 RepID=UPI00160D02C2